MTPTELTQYLDVLRAGNAMSAELVLPGGAALRVVFSPAPLDGDPVTKDRPPGDWKKWAGQGEP